MTVLNLCRDDWANFMFDITQAMKSVGIVCDAAKQNAHVFNYKKECAVLAYEQILREIKTHDVIQLFHSDHTFLPVCKKLNKPVIVWHAGSTYRRQPEIVNGIFNDYVQKSVIALGELTGLGAKNEVYCVGAVDAGAEPVLKVHRPYMFAHYPSNAEVKGTEDIVRMMTACMNGKRIIEFKHDVTLVDALAQRERMMNCDVYVELFKPLLDGKQYGSFGMTALEAAALGKIGITQNLCQSVYEKNYGDCQLLLANTTEDFVSHVINIAFSTEEAIMRQQKRTREWLVEKHSYQATGEYIKKHIL